MRRGACSVIASGPKTCPTSTGRACASVTFRFSIASPPAPSFLISSGSCRVSSALPTPTKSAATIPKAAATPSAPWARTYPGTASAIAWTACCSEIPGAQMRDRHFQHPRQCRRRRPHRRHRRARGVPGDASRSAAGSACEHRRRGGGGARRRGRGRRASPRHRTYPEWRGAPCAIATAFGANANLLSSAVTNSSATCTSPTWAARIVRVPQSVPDRVEATRTHRRPAR